MSDKDYVVYFTYEGEIYLSAEDKEEALKRAKDLLEETHGNNISDASNFTVEERIV